MRVISYRMDDVLDALTAPDGGARPLETLCTVRRGAVADGFIVDAKMTLLDLDAEDGIAALAALVEEVPLYRLNIELALDAALTASVANATLREALAQAFTPAPLPGTLSNDQTAAMEGGLRHPVLEHCDAPALAGIYARFLRALRGAAADYFDVAVLGQHPAPFAKAFDGFLAGDGGKIKAAILLTHGRRPDHESARPLEDYIAHGQTSAAGMAVTDAREALWAWLEADHDQGRRCRAIDRVKTLLPALRTPDWVRDDIFVLLKKEAMKQHFADILLPDLTLVKQAPSIAQEILANAQGQVNELLQQLLAQTLNIDAGYSGAAGRFAEVATARRAEAVAAKLV